MRFSWKSNIFVNISHFCENLTFLWKSHIVVKISHLKMLHFDKNCTFFVISLSKCGIFPSNGRFSWKSHIWSKNVKFSPKCQMFTKMWYSKWNYHSSVPTRFGKVYLLGFGRSRQLCLDKCFDPRAPSMRKVDDGEKKEKENNVILSGH